jgi:hypothetical protein
MKLIFKVVWQFISTALLTIFAIWFISYVLWLLT